MRIGIDARLYAQTGVGRYIKNLIYALAKLDNENDYYVYLQKKEFTDFIVPNSRWNKRLLNVGWHTLREQVVIPYLFIKDKIDVAHFPYFNVPLLYPGKYLLTIHDLIVDHFKTGRATTLPFPLYLVKRVGYKIGITLGIRKASWIAAISQSTKKEIIEHYHPRFSTLSVTYDALDTRFDQAVRSKKRINYFKFPYILYIGNAYPHKNLERLIQAFKKLNTKRKIRLVLAGDDHFFYPRLKRNVEMQGLTDMVRFFGEASDKQLVNLYSFARLVVFPSLMEGFGLPNFEALRCGRLPVISDIPVFRELWNNNLLYFNPHDETDISDTLLYALNLSSKDYHKIVKKAAINIQRFTWEKTANDTLSIYKKIYIG